MANKPKGRRRPRGTYIKGNVNETLALSTLAASDLIAENFDEVVNEKTRVSSIVATYTWDNAVYDGTGPIIFGVAHSDYEDAEVEVYIENLGSWDSGDLISLEIGKRKIRKIGVFAPDASSDAAIGDVRFNEGRPFKTKLNWMLATGDTLQLWAYNTGATLTGASNLRMEGHANLWQL